MQSCLGASRELIAFSLINQKFCSKRYHRSKHVFVLFFSKMTTKGRQPGLTRLNEDMLNELGDQYESY